MENKIYIPPIKSQGIKTKLVPWINSIIPNSFNGVWIEPFMGTGVVSFNIAPKKAIMSDTNPHLIDFYKSLQKKKITPGIVRDFLEDEGKLLENKGEEYYYTVRDRFNKYYSPLDFLFLNRSCFNGMIRFNKKGGFNVPFCKKQQRFSKSYITKITNQVTYIYKLLQYGDYTFICQDFKETIKLAKSDDLVYLDPPYIGRHTDYFNGWDQKKENELYLSLLNTSVKFILSTWHHNDYRKNEYIEKYWKNFLILTKEHFYHVGAKESNRNPMVEALVTNLNSSTINENKKTINQLYLFEQSENSRVLK